MSDNPWFVSLNGAQLENQHTVAEVMELVQKNQGANLLVWRQGMAGWQTPETLPEFSAPAAPVPRARVVAAPARASAAELGQQMGFLRSLFNFSFEAFVTPKMVSVLYAISVVAIGLGCLAMLAGGVMMVVNSLRYSLGFGAVFKGLVWLILAPVLSLVYVAFARMFFEIVVVLFKIKDNTAK